MSNLKIGYIGVGLMGHGAARNILEKGYPLTVMAHRNRAPVEDLVTRGAREAKNAAEIARASDILFLCLPSSVEVEATVYGPNGVLAGGHAGLIVVDSTTADPDSTRRIAGDLEKLGVRMVDAPLGRTPKEAEQGALSTYVGGDPESKKTVRPVMECYADTIVEVGPLGAAHTMKLINNFISIGTCAVISEAAATAAKIGVDMRKFCEVISAGGANSKIFQMVIPWLLEGDDSHLKGPLRIAGKDMRFYTKRFLPVLPGILAELNGAKIRDL
jgi:3-hydroxyisobutyrate dehydrogenase-like beta-hydroxyacid dehydrogenase